MTNRGFVKVIKVAAILFFSLTATINLLGGVGTVCAAFLTENFPSMSAILPYRGLYQIVMVLTVLTGIAGVWLTIRLIRGGRQSYQQAVLLLGAGTLLAAIQVSASLILRGKAVPANMKLYANVMTLLIFLILGLPSLRQRISFETDSDQTSQDLTSGLAAFASGILLLTTSFWVGTSHVSDGVSWVDVLREPLLAGGAFLLLSSGYLLARWALRLSTSLGRERSIAG